MKQTVISLIFGLIGATSLCAQRNFYHFSVADGLLNNQVRQIVELPNGQIFVATEGMFSLYNGERFVNQECNLDSIYRLPSFGGHSHLWQGDSLLWLKDFYSLYLYDTRTRRFRYDYELYLDRPDVHQFIHERGDSLTKAKVEALHPLRASLETLTRHSPLYNEWLQAYLRDRQGGEWFGLQSAGIVYAPFSLPSIQCLNPVSDDIIYRLEDAGNNRAILAGIKGIYLYNRTTWQLERVIEKGNINSFNILKDNRERIWISTMQALFCYDNGKVLIYGSGNVKDFPHWHIRFAYPMSDGRVLVCTMSHTLGYLYPEEARFEVLNDKIPELNHYRTIVSACATDNPDILMVCTQNGLFLLNTATNQIGSCETIGRMEQFSRKYNCIYRDHQQRTWIGTQNGLLVTKGDTIRRITTDDGLSNNCIQSITEDNAGCLWIGTSYGINRVALTQDRIQIFPLPIRSAQQREVYERGSCTMNDGMVYFTTRGGIVCFSPDDFVSENHTLQVVPIGIRAGGEPIEADTAATTLHYRQNYIEIQFSALNYVAPEHTRYRYRLIGWDYEWIYANEGNALIVARYNALPAGTYTFEVQATEGDTKWGHTLRKKFIIRPPWWLTWWAKGSYILTIISALTISLSLYLRERRKKMERENEKRVNHLFELREEARHHFVHSVNIEPEKIAINKSEEVLIEKIMDAIQKNMDNSDYTIDILARDIGMSRSAIYKKMQQMLGITPNEFLRNVRLKHAAALLAETDLSVTQVSLTVGFLTTRYFSQCFKKTFGVLPTEYRGAHQDTASLP